MQTSEHESSTRHRVLLGLSYLLAQVGVLMILVEPIRGLGWTTGFRHYFSSDQLSYAAIAIDVANGDLRMVEPLSQTGTSFYPSAWYFLVGLLARATSLSVPSVWTLLGLCAVGGAVGLLGWSAVRVSGLAFAPILPALALFTGTWSTLSAGNWFTHLSTHAVLWGPFGSLFTLNAEAIGLMLGTCAIALALLCAAGLMRSDRTQQAAMIVAAAITGGLANVHTYAFFTTVSLMAVFIAIWCLRTYQSRSRTVATLVLVGLVLALGQQVAAAVGPLPTLALALAALLPAVLPLLRAHVRMAALLLAVLAITSGLQVVRTVLGLAGGNEFLLFRETDSSNLSVQWDKALLAVVPLTVIALAAAWMLRGRGATAFKSLLVALPAGAVVMAANDVWGFDQEPYRFWLQYLVVGSLLISIVLARALASLRCQPNSVRARDLVVLALVTLVWATSLVDFQGFRTFARDEGVIDVQTPRLQAAAQLLHDRPGLVVSSNCLDPQVLKLATGAPVVYYNQGLAWPVAKDDFLIFQDPGRRAGEDVLALTKAGVDYVLTDSACADDWSFPAGWQVMALDSETYQGDQRQTLTLYRVQR
ncbi:MAG: hypothetical protein Q7L55_12735 [Actinomycetota bacterium]|nr:hypothetical protein [Actinomycetota bacterium]